MTGELLEKYIWLVQLFIRAGQNGLDLEEVQDKWEFKWDSEYSRRSFCNHREAIDKIFGIRIDCNRSTNRYFIDSSSDVSDEESATGWLINTFTVNNLLAQSKDRLSGRVSVEDIPSGHRYLTEVMEAMEDNHILEIVYLKYHSTEPEQLTIHPYAVKEAARRWYLVGYCEERKGMRVYGMDRIQNMVRTDKTFKMPHNFDVDALFATSYGVYLPEDGKSEEIVFRAGAKESKFLTDLPFHESQKVVRKEGDSTVFSIRVCPNESLIMDILQRGDKIEILSPQKLRDTIKEELNKTIKLYE